MECDFNGTTLVGSLYTRKLPTLGQLQNRAGAGQGGAGGGNGEGRTDFGPWPYAVTLSQTVSGGANTPTCWRMKSDGRRGDRIVAGLVPQAEGRECECGYRNF